MKEVRPEQVRESVAKGEVPLGKFVITKQLTKRPEDYPDARNQPHVQVIPPQLTVTFSRVPLTARTIS